MKSACGVNLQAHYRMVEWSEVSSNNMKCKRGCFNVDSMELNTDEDSSGDDTKSLTA